MQTFKNQSGAVYTIEKHPKSGWIITRVSTGSKCKISAKKVETVRAKLAAGESIPFRGIDYTVAIETGILFLLRDEIHIDQFSKTYTKR